MLYFLTILTVLNAFMMALITISYFVAWKVSRSRHMAALTLFFLMAAVVTTESVIQIIIFLTSRMPLPEGTNLWLSFIVTLAICGATAFLLVSTWWPLFTKRIKPTMN